MASIRSTDLLGNIIYKNELGEYHRPDGPAVECADGDKYWFVDGKRHRLDGPAKDYADGTKFWYYKGKYIKRSSQKEFEKIIKLLAFL